MPDYSPWDVIKVPFPYTDRPVRERRPAVVVAADGLQQEHGLLWVLMITSAANPGWPGDVAVSDLAIAGLPADSVVRTAKIATIDAREAERIGRLPAGDRALAARALNAALAPAMG
ncbi:MAG: type II toxin-antitoxin system PemK/MazF family toxin [Azospirillaceae bacterium]|nr:type II toxin-antitoxin system PemK/MazF family toxin [Azospirillaceae bacterium]